MTTDAIELWNLEYKRQGISTSKRKEPSRAALFFRDFLVAGEVPLAGRLLDLGCGIGRNALFFARLGFSVHGLDFSAAALEAFRDMAAAEGLESRVASVLQRMDCQYPFDDSFFEHCICFTAIENLLADEQVLSFKREVSRVLRPGGYFAIYFLTESDGFYGPRVKRGPVGEKLVSAEDNGLTQRVYSYEEVLRFFQDGFKICQQRTFQFEDERYGTTYQRHLEAMVFRRVSV